MIVTKHGLPFVFITGGHMTIVQVVGSDAKISRLLAKIADHKQWETTPCPPTVRTRLAQNEKLWLMNGRRYKGVSFVIVHGTRHKLLLSSLRHHTSKQCGAKPRDALSQRPRLP